MNHNTIKKSFFNHGFVVVKNVLSKKQIDEIFIDLEKIKKLVLLMLSLKIVLKKILTLNALGMAYLH